MVITTIEFIGIGINASNKNHCIVYDADNRKLILATMTGKIVVINPEDYVELKDSFAMADVVVSRAGANSICELLALKKPNILIPLSTKSSRGDQMLNARSFEQQGFSLVIDNDDLDEDILVETIEDLYKNREKFIENMNKSNLHSATNTIVKLIDEQIK